MASLMTIRPEELFFLGEIMEAEYIDYSYIQAMEESEQSDSINTIMSLIEEYS